MLARDSKGSDDLHRGLASNGDCCSNILAPGLLRIHGSRNHSCTSARSTIPNETDRLITIDMSSRILSTLYPYTERRSPQTWLTALPSFVSSRLFRFGREGHSQGLPCNSKATGITGPEGASRDQHLLLTSWTDSNFHTWILSWLISGWCVYRETPSFRVSQWPCPPNARHGVHI